MNNTVAAAPPESLFELLRVNDAQPRDEQYYLEQTKMKKNFQDSLFTHDFAQTNERFDLSLQEEARPGLVQMGERWAYISQNRVVITPLPPQENATSVLLFDNLSKVSCISQTTLGVAVGQKDGTVYLQDEGKTIKLQSQARKAEVRKILTHQTDNLKVVIVLYREMAHETVKYTMTKWLLDKEDNCYEDPVQHLYQQRVSDFLEQSGHFESMILTQNGRLAYHRKRTHDEFFEVCIEELGQAKKPFPAPLIIYPVGIEPLFLHILENNQLLVVGSTRIQVWGTDTVIPIKEDVEVSIINAALFLQPENVLLLATEKGLCKHSIDDQEGQMQLTQNRLYCMSESPCGRFIACGGGKELTVFCRKAFSCIFAETLEFQDNRLGNEGILNISTTSSLVVFACRNSQRTLSLLETIHTKMHPNFQYIGEKFPVNSAIALKRNENPPLVYIKCELPDGSYVLKNAYSREIIQLLSKEEAQQGQTVEHITLCQNSIAWIHCSSHKTKQIVQIKFDQLGQKIIKHVKYSNCKQILMSRDEQSILIGGDDQYSVFDGKNEEQYDLTNFNFLTFSRIERDDIHLQKHILNPSNNYCIAFYKQNIVTAAIQDEKVQFKAIIHGVKCWDTVKQKLIWLTDFHFLLPKTDKIYQVYRAEDGNVICSIDLSGLNFLYQADYLQTNSRNELTYLEELINTVESEEERIEIRKQILIINYFHMQNPYRYWASAIVDTKTGRIYNSTLKSLIHLGATSVHAVRRDLYRNNGQQIEVLGLPAPALFLYNLFKFQQLTSQKKKLMLTEKGLDYCAINDYDCQNIFTQLLMTENAHCLEGWLDPQKTSYFQTNTSPLQLVKSQCADQVLTFLEQLISQKRFSILIYMNHEEIMNFINLPTKFCMKFFSLITQTDNNCFMDIRYIELNSMPVAKIHHFNQLEGAFDETIRKDIRDKLFKGKGLYQRLKRLGSFVKERPIQFNRVLVPIFFKSGSIESMKFLKTLISKGPTSDIWSDRMIQAILKKKEAEMTVLTNLLAGSYLLYMFCLFYYPENFNLFLVWFAIQYVCEMIKIMLDLSNGYEINHVASNMISGWKLLNTLRLFLLFLYLWSHYAQWQIIQVYALTSLIIVSWIGLFSYLRVLKYAREMIQQVIAGLKAVRWFLVIFALFIFAISTAFYEKKRLEGKTYQKRGFGWWGGVTSDRIYFDLVISQFKQAFGDLDLDDISDYDFPTYILTVFSTLLITMFMMSLLVGVLTEAVGKVSDNKEKNNYYTLCEIIHDTESYLFFSTYARSKKIYVVFANYRDVPEERGRTGVVLDRQNQIETHFNHRFDKMEQTIAKMSDQMENIIQKTQNNGVNSQGEQSERMAKASQMYLIKRMQDIQSQQKQDMAAMQAQHRRDTENLKDELIKTLMEKLLNKSVQNLLYPAVPQTPKAVIKLKKLTLSKMENSETSRDWPKLVQQEQLAFHPSKTDDNDLDRL